MSETWGRLEEEEAEAELSELKAGSAVGRAGRLAPLNVAHNEALKQEQQGPPHQLATQEAGPSPSSEGTGLLSLPWEMVAHIASHLPAQCVITVLPQVCRALGGVGEDSTAWQLRARRLIGPAASFPMGPRESFDWPAACLEMEELISRWRGAGVEGDRGEGLGERGAGVEGDRGEGLGERGAGVERDRGEGLGERDEAESEPPVALQRFSLPSGHFAEVNTVLLVGGEGALCASGSRDRNVNLWDLRGGARGTLLRTLGGRGLFSTHRGWVWCLAARGPLLCSGSFDSTVRLWDLGAGGSERGLIQGGAAVICLACQSHTLVAGSYDKKVSIYDTRAAEPLVKSLCLHGNAVLCLAADEQYILSGSKDRTLAVFDRRAGKPLQKLSLSSYLLSMSYSGKEVWAGDNQGLIHTFALRDGLFQPVSHFDVGHHSLVTGIHSSAGTLYTCSSDRTIKVHLPSAPPRTLCSLRHPAGVNGLSVEGGVLAVASGEMCVEVWRPQR
ncbi:F-box/WD repeat-containing protein 9 [Conger conger]|uniref:F-box/WD repeat-containing protein 9 n=1 Tax=Conger conger TaxID=82655 RepID=UPI002A59EF8D|nr:F-box/WD repeat-containing protein 9 [Conger conger]